IPVRLRREGFARSSSIQPFHSEVSFLHAAGISDESVDNTTGQTFLRGYQITDSNGAVTFKTVVPGWYSGRTIHIHVMIRTLSSSGSVLTEFTTQLFFDQTLLNALRKRRFSVPFAGSAGYHGHSTQHL